VNAKINTILGLSIKKEHKKQSDETLFFSNFLYKMLANVNSFLIFVAPKILKKYIKNDF